MIRDNPTDAEIRAADAVILFDFRTDWLERVVPIPPERPSVSKTASLVCFLNIPVNSTDKAAVGRVRERINAIRPTE